MFVARLSVGFWPTASVPSRETPKAVRPRLPVSATRVPLIQANASPSSSIFQPTIVCWLSEIPQPLEASSPEILNSVIGPDEIQLFTCPAGEHRNFLDCVKTRIDPYFPAEVGHRCSTVAHIGNIAMELGRKLRWNPDTEEFADDETANRMRSRARREPWHLYL